MMRKQSWPSLLLFAALLAIAVSPVSALAGRGDRQSDLPGEPLIIPIEYEFGDPEPGGNGSPYEVQWSDFVLLKQVLIHNIQLRIATYTSSRSSSRVAVHAGPRRTIRGLHE